jgi:methyl-accepting chemotaxis protein
MSAFTNLSLGAKLGVSFGATLVLTSAVAIVGYASTASLGNEIEKFASEQIPRVQAAGELQALSRELRIRTMRIALANNKQVAAGEAAKLKDDRAAWEKAVQTYQSFSNDAEDKRLFAEMLKVREVQADFGTQILALANAGQFGKARAVLDGASRKQFREELIPALDKLYEWNRADSKADDLRAQAAVLKSQVMTAGFGILAILVGLAASILVRNSILGPVKALSSKLESLDRVCLTGLNQGLAAMEKGDLTVDVHPATTPVENPSKDELGQMSTTFNQMLDKVQMTMTSYMNSKAGLSGLVRSIQESSEDLASTSLQLERAAAETGSAATHIATNMTQVTSAAGDAAKSSQQIANGSESLANSAQDASAAVGILENTLQLMEDASRGQLDAAGAAQDAAGAGEGSVLRTIASMERIKGQMEEAGAAVEDLGQKGAQIGMIVQTIQGLAQQTNLLALNAAIEAARAGEQGRGFAVVADEVRKLAEGSSASAKQIAGLISAVQEGVEAAVKAMEASGTEVEDGAKIAQEAGRSLSAIHESTLGVMDSAKVGESRLEGMKAEFRKVSEAIAAAAAISEETAAGAEEMSASSEEVSASAQTVSAAVEEQTAQIEEVSASSEKLSAIAQELKGLASSFKVSDLGDEVRSRSAKSHLRAA